MVKRRYDIGFKVSSDWQKWGIQALVCPAFSHCSFRATEADDMGLMFEYIFLWSVIYFPGGVVPITQVQEDEQDFEIDENNSFTKLIKASCQDSKGMPINV
jgi:hypothetical protein